MRYIVTRHLGAVSWLKDRVGEPVVHIHHLDDPCMLQSGDTVYGTLPMYLVAEVCARGVRYVHLEVELPKHLRGQDLTAAQLTKLNAELVEYTVTRRTRHDRFLTLGGDLEDLL